MIDISWGAYKHLYFFPFMFFAWALLGYRLFWLQRIVTWLTAGNYRLVHAYSFARHMIKLSLYAIALLFLFVALLRPQWNNKEEIIAQEGRDLFIALDVSKSMLATDYAPSRLSGAKEKIKQLLAQLACERVGLILFAGSAFVQCPLTTDYSSFYMFLDQVDAQTIASGTTALDQAIKQTLQSFATMPERKNKLLVIVTDGEDFSSDLRGYKEQAQQVGLHIFTLGIGTAHGAPIPLYDEDGKGAGHQKDAKGNVVISRLNEGILKTLAADVGGSYVHVSPGDADVHAINQQIARFEKEKFDDKKVAYKEEQYPYFLLVSFMCLVLEWLL